MKHITKIAAIIMLPILFSTSKAFGQNQANLNQITGSGYQKADAELNSIYKQIVKQYASDTSFISHLKASQRLWIKFRDAELLMKYPPRETDYYGSAQSSCEANYLEQLTRDRIKTLKVWIDGIEEGDLCSGSVKNK